MRTFDHLAALQLSCISDNLQGDHHVLDHRMLWYECNTIRSSFSRSFSIFVAVIPLLIQFTFFLSFHALSSLPQLQFRPSSAPRRRKAKVQLNKCLVRLFTLYSLLHNI